MRVVTEGVLYICRDLVSLSKYFKCWTNTDWIFYSIAEDVEKLEVALESGYSQIVGDPRETRQ